jgi:hypothetical protein
VVNTTSAAGQMAGCPRLTTVVVGATVVGGSAVDVVTSTVVVVAAVVVVASTVVLAAVVDTLVGLVVDAVSESSLHAAASRPPTASTANTARNGEVMQTVSRI